MLSEKKHFLTKSHSLSKRKALRKYSFARLVGIQLKASRKTARIAEKRMYGRVRKRRRFYSVGDVCRLSRFRLPIALFVETRYEGNLSVVRDAHFIDPAWLFLK